VEVNSRLSAQGEHLQQLNTTDLTELCKQLENLNIEAVAINLLFSFIDDSEERKIELAVADYFSSKKLFISRSSDVLPEYKEFERGMTTTLNAKVGPLMQGYLHRLEDELLGRWNRQERSHDDQLAENSVALSIMKSSGGSTSVEHAGRYPVNLLLSGPAGGLKGAQHVASASGVEQLLSFDMGGTSTDVSIIDKEIGFTTGAKIAGYPVAVPMVDMHTIGAGGGSIAQVDAGGLLLVGPESAGASPGPACYGNGGKRPTVTDANVVLARLLPQSFLGGNMSLDKEAAFAAVQTIADALSSTADPVTVEQAALGIIDVVNDHMVRALRVMSVERGEDPKDYTLVSFGGAGGLHVCALAEELEMTKALVPVDAGVLSALGMLVADASRERSRTVNRQLKDCDEDSLNNVFSELLDQTKGELAADDVSTDDVNTGSASIEEILSVDVRYRGQSNTLSLFWSNLQNIERLFHQKHEDSYGHQLDIDIELVNVRVRVIERRQSFELAGWQPTEKSEQELISMPGIEKPVVAINRASLEIGQKLKGPLLITETSSTTWLAEDWHVTVDDVGNLLLFNQCIAE
ncbi:MAG: hydantoinase/oxoprolinase family protein, partial [Proteobacteria bacterium]|nr:hydantoinase/oxoprolinase family protein [Pseudomonadota bacterium]